MKLITLINKFSWPDIKPCFLAVYGPYYERYKHRIRKKKIKQFESAFVDLQNTPAKATQSRIIITPSPDNGVVYGNVSILNGKRHRDLDYSHLLTQQDLVDEEVYWAIGSTPWNECLGMEIEPESFDSFDEVTLIAHCLWELTFFGYTQTKNT